jgi:hypothetical protein
MSAHKHACGPSGHDAAHASKRTKQARASGGIGANEPPVPHTNHRRQLAAADPPPAVSHESGRRSLLVRR